MSQSKREQVQRLHRLLDMVREAYSWRRADLARALQRDPSSVYPSTNNAKMDFIERLARLLEWPIDAVVETIRYGAPGCGTDLDGGDGEPAPEADFETLLNQAREAYKHGQYERTIRLARQMLRIAKTPTERAYAYDKEASGWDGLGHYAKSVEAHRLGLQESPIPQTLRRHIECNLATAYYLAGDLSPAYGIAHRLVGFFEKNKPDSIDDRICQAFAYYARGSAATRLVAVEPERAREPA